MNDEVMRLVPRRMEDRDKPFCVEEKLWREAVSLVYQRGYRPNTYAGLDKRTVPDFLKELRRALETNAEARERLAGLVEFLEGSGRLGFTTSRGYRRAC